MKMFYDLFLGGNGGGEQARREVVAMAMRLGYSGVAVNHMVTGVLADSDFCKLRPLELKSVLAAARGIEEGARLHREALGVPPGLPFRQFSRITVVVDQPAQASVVNSFNPILRSYDMVAVRPTNQKAFNQACSQLEVDLISLDLSQKLPFRMKMAVIKEAVERGVYFEILYSRSLFDTKARRDLFANAQVLHAVSRGRNMIVSSGARRAIEMRGPNDVANMASLFGLSQESAKAAVSRNCKSVLLHGVARNKTYKSALFIQRFPVEHTHDPNSMFDVPTDWDPLSLGGASVDHIPLPPHPSVTQTTVLPSNLKKGAAEELAKRVHGSAKAKLCEPPSSFIPIKTDDEEWTEVKHSKKKKSEKSLKRSREQAVEIANAAADPKKKRKKKSVNVR